MKYFFISFLMVSTAYQAVASNSLSTVNSFAPGSSQINFTSVESARTLDHKNFSFLGFIDSSYQSLAIYDAIQTGNDVLSFTHIGLSYGLSPKLEIGIKGPAIFNQTSDASQASIVLTAQGFVNIDGFLKYRLLDSVKTGLTLMAQLGVANGDEIFYVGPGSGLNYAISALIERSFGRWLLAANFGYIQRNPGQQESLPFFEPIQSSVIGSVGLGRPITKSTKVSGEILMASHDFVEDNSDRDSFAAEALLSFHTKMDTFNLSYGAGAGLTKGIATPTFRGFLGFQYPFGFGRALAKNEESKIIEEIKEIEENKNPEVAVEKVEKPEVLVSEVEKTKVSVEAVEEPKMAVEIEQPESVFEVSEQPELLADDDDDDAFVDLTEQNMEDVFEDGGKPAQIAQELPQKEIIVREDIFSEQDLDEVRIVTQPNTNKTRTVAEANLSQKFILNHVEFDFESANLDQKSLKILSKVLEEIKKVSFKHIKVWGHTDFYGPSVYNEYLGLKRAKAVYDFFKKAGVPTPFIDYDAFGERRPVSVKVSPQERRKNRRVEVIVIRDED